MPRLTWGDWDAAILETCFLRLESGDDFAWDGTVAAPVSGAAEPA